MYVQALDYGIFLKLDSGHGFIEHCTRMLKLFVLLDSQEYVDCMVMFLNTLTFLRRAKTPVWYMYLHHLNCFNEEAGEISFSILSRAMLGDNHKHELDHMSTMYQLTPLYRKITREMQDDIGHLYHSSHTRANIKSDAPEVRMVAEDMIQVVKELRMKTFMEYDGSTQGYKNSTAAMDHQVEPAHMTIWWIDDISKEVCDAIEVNNSRYGSNWMKNYTDIWPEGDPDFISDIEDVLNKTLSDHISSSDDDNMSD